MNIHLPLCLRQFRLGTILLFIGIGFGLAGCDNTDVEAFESSEYVFSLQGRLEAGEAGSFIRVTPLRDTLGFNQRTEIVYDVSLRGPNGGTTLAGRVDTLSGRRVHNFRIDEAPQVGETYTLEAIRPDGQSSVVNVQMPQAHPDVEVSEALGFQCEEEDLRVDPPSVAIRTQELLPQVSVDYIVSESGSGAHERFTFDYRDFVQTTNGGWSFRLFTSDLINVARDLDPTVGTTGSAAVPTAVEVIVTVAGPDWPGNAYRLADLEEISTAGRFSNVEHGLGLVFGTATDTTAVPVDFNEDDVAACYPPE